MIIVTGGAGFIGSALIWHLNEQGVTDILVADRMGTGPKWKNLAKRRIGALMHKQELFTWLETEGTRANVEAIFHMGASSSTVETDVDYLVANNINYSARLWSWCAEYEVPFIYASSAATYGGGEQGFDDAPGLVDRLRPLNPYGFSKHKFDQWALAQTRTPPFWAGLKFFNVYGPQEYHKGSQASVVPQFVPQVREKGTIKLFKSYLTNVPHGDQARDFVYVKDCVAVLWHLFRQAGRGATSGIYNVGTGKARTFADLARAVFAAMSVNQPAIEYIEMPVGLRDQYQYHTQANLTRLRELAGYTAPFTALEAGVADYVRGYLLAGDPCL